MLTIVKDPNWVQAIAAVASLVVTIVLAAVTAVYVVYTRRMALQMVHQSQPVLIGRIEPFGNNHARYVLTNVGIGPAIDVELRLELDRQTSWRHALMQSGRSESFFLPVDGGTAAERFTALAAANKVLKVNLSYSDRNSRSMSATETIDLKTLVAGWDNARWHLPDSETLEAAKRIEKALERVAAKIK
jgi:hypothetical protein